MATLKNEHKGQKTFSRTLNKMVKIEEGAEPALLLDGRSDLFEPIEKKVLKPRRTKKKKEEKVEEIEVKNS